MTILWQLGAAPSARFSSTCPRRVLWPTRRCPPSYASSSKRRCSRPRRSAGGIATCRSSLAMSIRPLPCVMWWDVCSAASRSSWCASWSTPRALKPEELAQLRALVASDASDAARGRRPRDRAGWPLHRSGAGPGPDGLASGRCGAASAAPVCWRRLPAGRRCRGSLSCWRSWRRWAGARPGSMRAARQGSRSGAAKARRGRRR